MKSNFSFIFFAFLAVTSAYLVYATNVKAVLSVPLTAPVTAPTNLAISVISPNGGETLFVGQTYPILWSSSSNIDKVTIGYSTAVGSINWIANNVPNTKAYIWNVFAGIGTTFSTVKIYIIGYQTGVGSVSDYSDNNFTVVNRTTPTSTPTPTVKPTVVPTQRPMPTYIRRPTPTPRRPMPTPTKKHIRPSFFAL